MYFQRDTSRINGSQLAPNISLACRRSWSDTGLRNVARSPISTIRDSSTMQKKTLGTSYVHRGFSLIEMMMAFAVMMTLAGFAIPNIVTALNNMRLRGAASEFSG